MWEETTSPVGHFEPNGYGLYHMAGNASDWCSNRLKKLTGKKHLGKIDGCLLVRGRSHWSWEWDSRVSHQTLAL